MKFFRGLSRFEIDTCILPIMYQRCTISGCSNWITRQIMQERAREGKLLNEMKLNGKVLCVKSQTLKFEFPAQIFCLHSKIQIYFSDFLQFPSVSVSMPKKLPKFKKIRQWSHDSLANLSQLTNRVSNNEKSNQDGISTISSAIREQNFDPKKDNFGLYALKCDRSRSAVNAKRGILLNLPSSSTTTKLKGSGSFQTVDRNHEVFKSCEVVDDDENLTTKFNQKALKIVPPPRKKKKPNLHHKPQQKINKAGHGTITAAYETLERNDSGLYKIVNSTETAKITFVEPRVTAREMKSVTAFVKPKIEKAVVVKSTSFEGKR